LTPWGSVADDLESFRLLMSRRLAETLDGDVKVLKESAN
jgi:hypothetical protein